MVHRVRIDIKYEKPNRTQEVSWRASAVKAGAHMAGITTLIHGPGMSAQAQYIARLYEADAYLVTEMEAGAIAQVIRRTLGAEGS